MKAEKTEKEAVKRTDEQIIMAEPVMVTLGGKQYPVKPLTIRRSREWRKKLAEMGSTMVDKISTLSSSDSQSSDLFRAIMLEFPDQMLELVFAYAVDVPREIVMEEATDAELLTTFREVLRLAYPFAEEFQTLRALIPTGR